MLAYGGTTPALVQITAPMATSNGQFMLVGGTAGTTLELSTHTGGGQMVVFGDNDATLRIDASNILSYQSNTSVLANTKAHILDFQPGDTIDLAGLAPANLTYSYDTDTTYGSDVLELMNNGTLIGLLRFSNGVCTRGHRRRRHRNLHQQFRAQRRCRRHRHGYHAAVGDTGGRRRG